MSLVTSIRTENNAIMQQRFDKKKCRKWIQQYIQKEWATMSNEWTVQWPCSFFFFNVVCWLLLLLSPSLYSIGGLLIKQNHKEGVPHDRARPFRVQGFRRDFWRPAGTQHATFFLLPFCANFWGMPVTRYDSGLTALMRHATGPEYYNSGQQISYLKNRETE